jgi:hypothetical protein
LTGSERKFQPEGFALTFATYDPSSNTLTSLVAAIFSGSAGAALVDGSISVRFGVPPDEASTISFYDGSIAALNIGAGLLLTSGDPTPPGTNTGPAYGVDAGGVDVVDSDLQATVDAAFSLAGPVQDVTYLQFQINVTDPAIVGLRFDVVFGSDEFREFTNSSYVDVAGVYVNGANYALFNNSPDQPLSVVAANVNGGNFRDNTGAEPNNNTPIPIEYDGVSRKLQINAPIQLGLNTIKIAIADTGDSIYDSGIFVSSLQAVNYTGYGLAQQVAVIGKSEVVDSISNQVYLGDSSDNSILLVSGEDVVDGGLGIDKVHYTFGLAGITGYSWDGHALSLHSGANSSTLVNVERVTLGDGGYYALDTSAGDNTYSVYALLQAAFDHAPDQATLSAWVAQLDLKSGSHALVDVAQQMIDVYAPGVSNEVVIGRFYQNIVGVAASAETVAQLASQVGSGHDFATMGELFAFGAMLSPNTQEIVGIVGSIQVLDASFF